MENDIEKRENAVAHEVVRKTSVLAEYEVLVEQEGPEEAERISNDIRRDVPCAHPHEEEITPEIEGGCGCATPDVAAELVNVRSEAVVHQFCILLSLYLRAGCRWSDNEVSSGNVLKPIDELFLLLSIQFLDEGEAVFVLFQWQMFEASVRSPLKFLTEEEPMGVLGQEDEEFGMEDHERTIGVVLLQYFCCKCRFTVAC